MRGEDRYRSMGRCLRSLDVRLGAAHKPSERSIRAIHRSQDGIKSVRASLDSLYTLDSVVRKSLDVNQVLSAATVGRVVRVSAGKRWALY